MIDAILSLVFLAIFIAALIYWIKALADYKKDLTCDPDDCECCPFPCPQYKSKVENEEDDDL